jgi:hypothetical protein
VPQPTFDEDVIAALLAITDPLERAARITDYGRTIGTLPSVLATQRREDIEVSRSTLSASKVAARLRMARSGIFRITNPLRRGAVKPLPAPAGRALPAARKTAPTPLPQEA